MMKAMLGNSRRMEADWEDLWRQHVRTIGENIVRSTVWFSTPVANLRTHLEVHGAEHIDAAMDCGKGAVLLGSHTGHFLAQYVFAGSLGRQAWVFGNHLPSRLTEASFSRFHRRIGIERKLVLQGHVAGVTQLLAQNGVVLTFCDLTTVPGNNAWVPFGLTETLVNLGPALIALWHEAPLFVLTSRALPGRGSVVCIHPLVPGARTGNLLQDAYRTACLAMAIVTAEVNECPEQWWNWHLGRYRTIDGRTFGSLAPFRIRDFTTRRRREEQTR